MEFVPITDYESAEAGKYIIVKLKNSPKHWYGFKCHQTGDFLIDDDMMSYEKPNNIEYYIDINIGNK